MMTDTNVTTTTAPETATTHTEDNVDTSTAGKLFTQEQVNQIVSDRLTRERTKGEPTALDQREHDISIRENTMACLEFLTAEGFPAELLSIIDPTDTAKFIAAIRQLDEIVQLPSPKRVPVPFVKAIGKAAPPSADAGIADAFKPKI